MLIMSAESTIKVYSISHFQKPNWQLHAHAIWFQMIVDCKVQFQISAQSKSVDDCSIQFSISLFQRIWWLNLQFSIFWFLRINWWLQNYFFSFLFSKLMTATFNFRSFVTYESIHDNSQCEARAVLDLHLNFVTSCQKLWRLVVIFNILNCPLGSWMKSACTHFPQFVESTMYPEFHSDISMLASLGSASGFVWSLPLWLYTIAG